VTHRPLVLLPVVAAVLVLAGCGRDDELGGRDDQTRTEQRTTRVEVIKRVGADEGFDPEAIYRREAPGVVTVASVFGSGGSLLGGGDRQGVGSGFVLNGDGEIATNAHVVTEGEGKEIEAADEVFIRFADSNQVPAEVVGFDPNSDVALLRIDPGGLTLRPLPLGRSSALRVGAPVAAIGSPYNEPQSLSIGVISGLDRTIDSLTGFAIQDAIQTDAAVNRGNSGGPLLDADGEVLGINSQIRSTGGGSEGVGYAVPVDTVRRVLGALRRKGRVDYAFLGVQTTDVYPQLAERFDLPVRAGAWVQSVEDGGPAEDAGLRGGEGQERFQGQPYREGGDVITAVAGRRVRGPDELAAALARFGPDQKVEIELYRDGRRREIEVELAERPAESRPGR